LFVFYTTTIVHARDSTYHDFKLYKTQLVPSILIVGGIITAGNVKQKVSNAIPVTYTKIDDYIQYAPMAAMYIGDIAGLKSQNSVWDQTKYLALSQLTCAIVVQTLKYTIREQRPDNGKYNSFPSGHTSIAFVGATVLYHEFKDTHKILAYSGFGIATTVGLLRMTNRRHWVPDILAGAGIGILSTNMIYHFKLLNRWQPFAKSNKQISFSPFYNGESTGLSFAIRY
jgi:hypothetical protein